METIWLWVLWGAIFFLTGLKIGKYVWVFIETPKFGLKQLATVGVTGALALTLVILIALWLIPESPIFLGLMIAFIATILVPFFDLKK